MKSKENLKEVIQRNFDAYKGYQQASDKVNNHQLADSFRKQAERRKKFAFQLESEAKLFSQDTYNKARGGSLEGNLHRSWINLKTALSANKDEAILEECIRGEEESLAEYNELLSETILTNPLQSIVREQKETIQDCIHDLRRIESVID